MPTSCTGGANRLKVLVHDGFGIWLAARRLHNGKSPWPQHQGGTLSLSRAQLDALVLGLSWQRISEAGVITLLNSARPSRDAPMAPLGRHRQHHAP